MENQRIFDHDSLASWNLGGFKKCSNHSVGTACQINPMGRLLLAQLNSDELRAATFSDKGRE
jgi:hypothetical protein